MAMTRGTEMASIDVALVTFTTSETTPKEIAVDTAGQLKVTPQIETQDAVRLMVKGILRAQKREKNTLVGNTIVLTDNVFTPEVAQIVQGGTITRDLDTQAITGYTPPVAGSDPSAVEDFTLNAYAARYNTAGVIIGYEKCSYPHCMGVPVAFSSQDNVFRVAEYTIYSSPEAGDPPYEITYVTALPTVT